MSRKKIETIIRQAMAPFTLSQTGKAKVSQLVRTYPYELLVECIDIGIANYLTYEQDGTPSKESVELFIDKLGGIAYNKSQSSVNQGIIYVKNYCKKIYTYWNDNRATTLLNAYVVALRNAGWNEKLIESDLKTDMIFLCKRTTNWTCWYQAVEQWIEDINNWKNNCIKENGSVLPQSLIERINYTNVKLLCKQINASYESHLYDCAAMVMRKTMEILLILTFQNKGVNDDLLDGNGFYLTFDKIIKKADKNEAVTLSENTLMSMRKVKEIGNSTAHKIWYNTTIEDIDCLKNSFRTSVEELLYKSGCIQ